ncbi:MAG: riboflavin synthase [Spirochaetales bacterium]|nr:riboflavin synthase [Spirochaetales bacterium]
MFTGIIESQADVIALEEAGGSRRFYLQSELANEFQVDQSVCHDGVCLTVEEQRSGQYRVTAIPQTLERTTLGSWKKNQRINLERSLLATSRLDGHFVQGHVDQVASVLAVEERGGEWRYTLELSPDSAHLVVGRGSIAVNGISLTVADLKPHEFTVAIIPYTYQHTNMSALQVGSKVNLEFDILGKYLDRWISLRSAGSPPLREET